MLPKLLGLISPFVVGFIIYLICRGSVRRLTRAGIDPCLGALLSVGFLTAIILGLFAIVVTIAYNETEHLPSLYRRLSVMQSESRLLQKFLAIFRNELISFVKNLSVKLLARMGDITQLIMIMFFGLLSAFFFLKDEDKLVDIILRNGGAGVLKKASELKNTVCGALGGYIKAQIILMCFTFLILSVFLTLLGVKHSILIAFGVAFVDAIPVFGTGMVLLPWALWQFLFGSRSLAFGLVTLYGVCSLIRQIMEPKILSKQIGLHPLLTLAGIFIGFKLLGLWGLIMGPAVMLIFVTYLQKHE